MLSSRQGPPTRTGAGIGKGTPLHAMAVAASGTHFPTIPRPFLPEKEKSGQYPDKKDGFARSLSLRRLSPASVLSKRKGRAEARMLSSRQGPPTRTGAGIGKGTPLHAMAVAASGTHFPTIPRPFLPEKGKSEQCPDKKDGFARSLSLRRLFFTSILPKDGFARSLSLRRLFFASVLSKRKARAEARIPSSRQGPPTRTGGGIGKGACPFAFPSSAFPCFRFVEKKRPGGSALSFSPEKKS